MPKHERYVEPFCGSAAVFFNKPKAYDEILNDIDGNIVHFFKTIRERREDVVEYLQNLPYSFDEHQRIAASYYDGQYPADAVQRAAEFYYLRYSQFGSKTDAPSGFSRSSDSIRPISKFYKNSLPKLETVSERLTDALIENRSFEWIIDQYDHPEAVFYCDPPYLGTEDKYKTEKFEHQALLHTLEGIEGKCMLSYDHKFKKPGWCSVCKKSRYNINRGGRESIEYLYMNFDPVKITTVSEHKQSNLTDY
jgi:DNA adenine methylase